ncbi:MAG: AAA family ATPase [Actinomycetota bacterium]
MRELREKIGSQIADVVIGQEEAIDGLVIALVSGGHVLLQGVPGVAKTLLAEVFARCLGVDFRRVQFTPDMLPSDVTGTMTLSGGELVFRPGPVFTNVLLADEINRTPPRTQAALLEAMQERQVTIAGESRRLQDPFMVVATQNPIEYEGTYPLPEAQLDRFLLSVELGYPSETQEQAILRLGRSGVTSSGVDDIQPVIDRDALARIRHDVDATSVAEPVLAYIVAVARQTRELPSVELGASPRSAVHLLVAAKAMARMQGRDFVTPDDIAALAPSVLRHRLVVSAQAELEGFTATDAVNAAMGAVEVPR